MNPIQTLDADAPCVLEVFVKAAWVCHVCHVVHARQGALVYWDGTHLIGLICQGHLVTDIECAIAQDPEVLH